VIRVLLAFLAIVAVNVAAARADGVLYYGTTIQGGENRVGSVFTEDTTGRTTIYSLCVPGQPYCLDGAYPTGNIAELPDGSLVLSTSSGGYGAGTLLRLKNVGGIWKSSLIWNICWVYGDCAAYGTMIGTLKYLRTTPNGDYILKATCEVGDRGVLFKLKITPSNGNAMISLNFWNGPF
jgi:hypothetical protein